MLLGEEDLIVEGVVREKEGRERKHGRGER